jgi:hypothetical protein
MRGRRAGSVSEQEGCRSHLNEKLFAQQGHKGRKGKHFEQEVTEETKDIPTDASRAIQGLEPLLPPFPLVQTVCLCGLCGLAVNYFVSVFRVGWPPKILRCTAIGELGSGLNQG